MKYKNASNLLPEELLELVQEYVQGEYIYVPVKDKKDKNEESHTDYEVELEKRDAHIYTRYLEGISNKRLSRMYNLSESSIRRIIVKQRKEYLPVKNKLAQILKNWGLCDSDVKQIYDTTWQAGENYVLKIYYDFDMLKRNIQILQILEQMNIPVGKIVPVTRNNEQYVSVDNTFYLLSTKLQGSNVLEIKKDKEFEGSSICYGVYRVAFCFLF